jgi:hypothetical protein
MTTTTEFSFAARQQYLCKIDTNIILNLVRNNNSTAMVFFTDENNNLIPIPDKIIVFTYEMPSNLSMKSILSPIHPQYYALCWTDRYEILYDERLILSTETNRSWNIVTPDGM